MDITYVVRSARQSNLPPIFMRPDDVWGIEDDVFSDVWLRDEWGVRFLFVGMIVDGKPADGPVFGSYARAHGMSVIDLVKKLHADLLETPEEDRQNYHQDLIEWEV